MERIDIIIKKGGERDIKNARKYIENHIGLPFLKDETKIMMSELYDSIDEKNAKFVINTVTKAVKDDKVALTDKDIIRLTNQIRGTKLIMLICAIFFLISSISYYFIEYDKTFRYILVVQYLSIIIFLMFNLFLMYDMTILHQGHWNNNMKRF